MSKPTQTSQRSGQAAKKTKANNEDTSNTKTIKTKTTTELDVVNYFMQTSKGIKATAGHFGLSSSYVGALISRYIKKHNLRL